MPLSYLLPFTPKQASHHDFIIREDADVDQDAEEETRNQVITATALAASLRCGHYTVIFEITTATYSQ